MSTIDALELWSLDYRLLTSVIADIAPQINALGVEVKGLFVLGELDEHPHPAALAERLSMPKPTVTVHLKKLEAAGLIRREIDPTDLRRHRLTLTAAGRKVATRGLDALAGAFEARLARLTSGERATLRSLLRKMADTPR